MNRAEVALALGWVAIGSWLFIEAGQLRSTQVWDPIGPGGLAKACAAVFVAGGAVLAAGAWRKARPSLRQLPSVGPTQSSLRPLLLWGLAFAYHLVLPSLGFLLATPAFLAVSLAAMQVRAALKLVGIPITFTIACYLLFTQVFHMLLPLGLLSPYSDVLWFLP